MISKITSPRTLNGTIRPPGDKSISHRASLLNSISTGVSHVSNFCVGDDRSSMLGCLRALGVNINKHTNCGISTKVGEKIVVEFGSQLLYGEICVR